MKTLARLIPLLFALCVAAPSHADLKYISPNGNDSHDGSTFALRWKTMAHANASLRPGDTLLVAPAAVNAYDAFPNPDSAGSNPTNGGFIYYRAMNLDGTFPTDSASRRNFQLPAATLTGWKYTVIDGFRIVGRFFGSASSARDSVKHCNIDGNLEWYGQYSGFSNTSFNGAQARIQGPDFVGAFDGTTYDPANQNSFIDCHFTNLYCNGDGCRSMIVKEQDSLTVERCRIRNTMYPNVPDIHPNLTQAVRNSLFQDNYWDFVMTQTGGTGYAALNFRDYTGYVTVNRDTFALAPESTNGLTILLTNSGSAPGSVTAVSVDSSYFWLGDGLLWVQDTADSLSFTNNVVATQAQTAMEFSTTMIGPNLVQGNTFASRHNDYYATVTMQGPFVRDTTKVYSNLFFSDVADGQVPNPNYRSDAREAALYINGKTGGFPDLYKGNWNEFRFHEYTDAIGDRSLIAYLPVAGIEWHNSGVGGGNAAWKALFPATRTGDADSLSIAVYDSAFVNPNLDGSAWDFDPTPAPGSRGIGAGINGSDIGARASIAYPTFSMVPSLAAIPEAVVGVPDTALVTFTNSGSADLNVDLEVQSGSATVDVDSLSFAVAPGHSTIRTVVVTPVSTIHTSAYISVSHDAPQTQSPTYFLVWIGQVSAASSGGGEPGEGFKRP